MNKKNEAVFTFDAGIITEGGKDLGAIATASESLAAIAYRFYTRLLGKRQAKDVSPDERSAFVKACRAVAPGAECKDKFDMQLRRCGILSTVAREMGFPMAEHKAGKGGGNTELSPAVFKATTALRSAVKGLMGKGLTPKDILIAVDVAIKAAKDNPAA